MQLHDTNKYSIVADKKSVVEKICTKVVVCAHIYYNTHPNFLRNTCAQSRYKVSSKCRSSECDIRLAFTTVGLNYFYGGMKVPCASDQS